MTFSMKNGWVGVWTGNVVDDVFALETRCRPEPVNTTPRLFKNKKKRNDGSMINMSNVARIRSDLR